MEYYDLDETYKEYEEYKYKEYQGKCLKNFSGGGKCPGGICPRGYLSGGNCLGGNCPRGNCPDTEHFPICLPCEEIMALFRETSTARKVSSNLHVLI